MINCGLFILNYKFFDKENVDNTYYKTINYIDDEILSFLKK